jgi:hypothetical protein
LTLIIFPWVMLEVIRIGIGALYVYLGFVSFDSQVNSVLQMLYMFLFGSLILMVIAGLTVFLEHKNIGATRKELVGYVISFPLYVLSYFPISFCAIFSRVEWKPITHGNPQKHH